MARLKDKVAIITGGAMGMGEAHARLFVEEGAKVVITDLAEEAGLRVADDLGENAIFVRQDVADPDGWQDVLAKARDAFGTVTILVNNAGISGPRAHTADLSIEDFRRIMSVNAEGTFYGMRAVIPGMIEAGGGSIVNISSVAAFTHSKVTPNLAYTASKFAIRGMTKAASTEYAGRNIRVNSVHPGGVVTPIAKIFSEADLQKSLAEVPIGRFGEPREIARLVLFLASDESSYITGAAIVADGGKLR